MLKQSKYVELRLRVSQELKETLLMLGEANGVSANQIATMLVNQVLNKEPNLLDAMREATELRNLEKRLMPFYHGIFDSYSLLATAPPTSDTFKEKCQKFKENADLFVHELNKRN